ncbi:ABC transporter ATP-binding protein [uncultured Vagococcus sp.]|uniref:ABC transporter ATP-binding protein n=1 Tax=uncultured Vagococcus sp. TaxID=189676 RepID=UPI0028D546B7|nr:ABC transporter ATP-binding protein [uncultured Vagococcus sp.]
MSLIKFENVSRFFKVGESVVKAVDKISFEINQGDFVVILGSSGSGKSSTLNLLGGLDSPTEGEITIDGKKISDFSNKELTLYRRATIGFVFQFYNLIPNLNAFENVDISRKLSNDSLNADEILKAVGLEDRKTHFPSNLSGGEMQRVSIARAICKNPKILLCDEPTGALDSETGKNILKLLKKISDQRGITIIMVTHNSEITKLADKVITMKDGSIVAIETNETPLSPEEVVL